VPAPNWQAASAIDVASSLVEKTAQVARSERASFHTPGHKGRPQSFGKEEGFVFELAQDLTELPGLDDLSQPEGVLANLENRLASLFGARRSFISVNGASACLIASMMVASSLGSRILVPANLHRSAVFGLALANLEPVWYKPDWNADYGFYEQVCPRTIESELDKSGAAALLIVSPTYQGAVSDIGAIAAMCRKKGVLLIVDEAHGAHLLSPLSLPVSALECGADIVVHSLHKTLPALTQTGALHIAQGTKFSLDHIRALLNGLQTSSPSYHLMASIEHMVDFIGSEPGHRRLRAVQELAQKLRSEIEKLKCFDMYSQANLHEPLHVLIRARFQSDLADELQKRGIGTEAVFNQSVLLLLGLGSEAADLEVLLSALADIAESANHSNSNSFEFQKQVCPPLFQQATAPASAFSAPSQVVQVEDAVGRICVECIAPCPPGTPVVVPGQLVTDQVLAYMLQFTGIRSLRVVQNT